MDSKNSNSLLPVRVQFNYHVSELPKPYIFTDAYGNRKEGQFVITAKLGENYYVVAQRTRIFLGPTFNKKDYDTLVSLLMQAYVIFRADPNHLDSWVPGVKYSVFPWFFETQGEAEYYLDLYKKKELDLVDATKTLTRMTWAQFHREYYLH